MEGIEQLAQKYRALQAKIDQLNDYAQKVDAHVTNTPTNHSVFDAKNPSRYQK